MGNVTRFSRARFETAFNAGQFDVREGETVLGKADWWWVGGDGYFWIEYLFPTTGKRLAWKLAAVADEEY